jgi:signal transduction histidine kinase
MGKLYLILSVSMMLTLCTSMTRAQNFSFESKEQSLNRIESELQEYSDPVDKYVITRRLYYLQINDDVEAALETALLALEYAKTTETDSYIGHSYTDIANANLKLGEFNETFRNLQLAKEYQDLAPQTSAYYQFYLGKLYSELGFFDIAQRFLTFAETEFISDRNKWLASYELAKITFYQNPREEVLEQVFELEASIPEIEGAVNPEYLFHYVATAELFALTNNTDRALFIVDRVYDYLLHYDRNYYLGIANRTRALSHFELENYADALIYAEQAHAHFRDQMEYSYLMQSTKLLSDIHFQLNNLPKAYEYLAEYFTLRETVSHAKNIAANNQILLQQGENESFLYQLAETEEGLKKRLFLNIILGLLLILLLFSSVLLWRKSRESKANTKKLKELNTDKNHFIGVVSHDLRSPLNSIMVLSEFMLEDPASVDESTAKEYGAIIFNASQQMQQLINNMLDVNKIEAKATSITLEAIKPTAIISSTVETMRVLGNDKGIGTDLSIENDLPLVMGDKNAIQRIIENLISNAYKFSSEGTTVLVKAQKIGSQVEIAIIDEGPGLTDLDKTKLFQKFQKLSASPTGTEKSTGLGLYIVKNLVKQMNGTILIESEQGKGTTFKVLLNIA